MDDDYMNIVIALVLSNVNAFILLVVLQKAVENG